MSRHLSPYSSSFYCRRHHLQYSLLAMVIVDWSGLNARTTYHMLRRKRKGLGAAS
jgi:hypothetical protein